MSADNIEQWYGNYPPTATVGNLSPYSSNIITCGDGSSQYDFNAMVAAAQEKKMTGNKPVVICNGTAHECKDMDEAQSKAETLAHQHSADAYILKPIKKVAPKRDTVTTDLP